MADTIAAQPSPDVMRHAMQVQALRHVRPGCWLRAETDDGVTKTESWHPVETVIHAQEFPGDWDVVRVTVIDQRDGQLVSATNTADTLVSCITERQARCIGLVAKEFPPEADRG